MRVRSTAAILLVMAVLPVGCSTSDDADSAGPEPEQVLATSGPDSEHALLRGTITRGDEPVAGAEVALKLWPVDPSDVEVGDVVDTLDVAVAETDDDGRYLLAVDPDELSSKYFNGDFLNFDALLTVDEELLQWGSTVSLVRDEYWRSDDRALVGDLVTDLSFDLEEPTVVLTDSFGDAERNDAVVFSAPRAG